MEKSKANPIMHACTNIAVIADRWTAVFCTGRVKLKATVDRTNK